MFQKKFQKRFRNYSKRNFFEKNQKSLHNVFSKIISPKKFSKKYFWKKFQKSFKYFSKKKCQKNCKKKLQIFVFKKHFFQKHLTKVSNIFFNRNIFRKNSINFQKNFKRRFFQNNFQKKVFKCFAKEIFFQKSFKVSKFLFKNCICSKKIRKFKESSIFFQKRYILKKVPKGSKILQKTFQKKFRNFFKIVSKTFSFHKNVSFKSILQKFQRFFSTEIYFEKIQ